MLAYVKGLYRTIFLALLSMTWIAACATSTQQPPRATEAWVRMMPAVSPNTAAYLEIHNPSVQDRELVGVSSRLADKVEMHQVLHQDGTVSMKPVESVIVPANASVVFVPGGLHLMVIGLREPLVEGSSVDLELHFKNGESLRVPFEVMRQQPSDLNPHHHH